VTKPDPLQTFKHEGRVNGAQFSRDESRVLTWSADKTARLWDVAKPDPLQTFQHDDYVNGAQFSRDESRVLTWSDDKTVRFWDNTDPLAVLTPSERIRELEVRSGTTLDEAQNLRLLKFDEWQGMVKPPKPAPHAQATNRQPTVETPGSSSKR
jgi:WD40 repeat protein